MPSTLDRHFDLLELLVEEPDGLPLSVVAERLDMPKSAVHRLLTALQARGYVNQAPVTRHYQATLQLTCLGLRLLSATGLVDVSQPVLDRLAAATGELARMTAADGDQLHWVAKAQGARSGLRYDVETGGQPRLFCTATGHAWLSTMSDEEALRIVYEQGWPEPRTDQPNAPRTVEDLLARLAMARRRGLAHVVDSATLGTTALAMPIRGAGTTPVVGTVSVAGPSVRIDVERLEDFAEHLRQAALELADLWPARLHQRLGMPPTADLARTAS